MKLPNGYGSITKINKKVRKPFWARGPEISTIDPETKMLKIERQTVGYYSSMEEALSALEKLYRKRNALKLNNITFKALYEKWSEEKFAIVGESSYRAYENAFNQSAMLHNRKIKDIKLIDLNNVVELSEKNYPTLKKLKLLFTEMFKYACMHEIIENNFAVWVDIAKYKNRNPNHQYRNRFSYDEIETLWKSYQTKEDAIILMLIYSGVRIGELLDLKKENVHLEENYFEILESKTQSGIRVVPISNKVKSFYIEWYNNPNNQTDYLLCNEKGNYLSYPTFRKKIYDPFINKLNIELTPHCTRHTTISMLADKHVLQTIIKKIVGHKGAMDITERVYTHIDIKVLVDAINQI